MHRLVPPIGIGGDNCATVWFTRNQDEGAGAHGVARGKIFDARCQIRGARGVVLFCPGAAEHAPIGDFLQQDWIGHGGFEIYGVVINLAHFLHGSEHTLHIRTRCARTFNAEHHIIGGKGRTIREFHIAAQMKAPNIRLRLFPAFGKCGFHLAFMVAANERFIEIGPEGEQEGLLPGIGVHGIHIAIIGPAEVIGLGRQGGTGQQSGGKGQAAQHEAFSPIRTRLTQFRAFARDEKAESAAKKKAAFPFKEKRLRAGLTLVSGDAERPGQISHAAINQGAIRGGIHGFRQYRPCGGGGDIGRGIAHFGNRACFCGSDTLHGKLLAPFGRSLRLRRRSGRDARRLCLGACEHFSRFLHGIRPGGFGFFQLRFGFKAELICLINPLANAIRAGIERASSRLPKLAAKQDKEKHKGNCHPEFGIGQER